MAKKNEITVKDGSSDLFLKLMRRIITNRH